MKKLNHDDASQIFMNVIKTCLSVGDYRVEYNLDTVYKIVDGKMLTDGGRVVCVPTSVGMNPIEYKSRLFTGLTVYKKMYIDDMIAYQTNLKLKEED